MTIREDMPVLARHEGRWTGVYIHVDADGHEVDRHESLLECRFPDHGDPAYHQTNTYTWRDGRQEVFEFPAAYADRRIHFDTPRIRGQAWEVDEHTVVLTWTRKDIEQNVSLYEMIQLSPCGQHRTRTWHWLRDGELFRRTLIKETRLP